MAESEEKKILKDKDQSSDDIRSGWWQEYRSWWHEFCGGDDSYSSSGGWDD